MISYKKWLDLMSGVEIEKLEDNKFNRKQYMEFIEDENNKMKTTSIDILAVCLKTYPDENYMRSFCEGDIKASDVKIYHKGKIYKVTGYYNKEYFKPLIH